MKDKKRVAVIAYLAAGILFTIAALLGKNYVLIPIGCCNFVLAFSQMEEKEK